MCYAENERSRDERKTIGVHAQRTTTAAAAAAATTTTTTTTTAYVKLVEREASPMYVGLLVLLVLIAACALLVTSRCSVQTYHPLQSVELSRHRRIPHQTSN